MRWRISVSNDESSHIKKLFENVEDILLKLIPSSDEYYDFLSIEDMVFYILDYGLIEHMSLFEYLLGSFFEVISFKLNSSKDYQIKYDEFSSGLIDVEQFFYTEIYEPSDNYSEEALTQISNWILN